MKQKNRQVQKKVYNKKNRIPRGYEGKYNKEKVGDGEKQRINHRSIKLVQAQWSGRQGVKKKRES